MINFLEPDEPFDPRLILQRLGEEKVSVISGNSDDVALCTADLDPDNILANNWAWACKSDVGPIPYCVGYQIKFGEILLEFESIPELKTHNQGIKTNFTAKTITDLWNELTLAHYKGLHTVHAFGVSMDKFQYRNYLTFKRNSQLIQRKESGLVLLDK